MVSVLSVPAGSDYETLSVDLAGRDYEILIGDNLLARAGALAKPFLGQPRVIIVTDATVAPLHLKTVEESFLDAGIAVAAIIVPAGEGTKRFDRLEALLDEILAARIERRITLVALGGGVIGDLTGFAAAILLRGIDFIQIPTTLLAQVDSSVGGKTGINTRHGKNLVGAFHQPRLVLADTGVLDTLPRRELLAGYAEVVKYGLLGDAGFFDWLEANGAALLAGDTAKRRYAVKVSCAAKAAIVARDEKETGDRALLNLGHTFGHALEAETGFGAMLLHGEGVAIGMVMAFDLSVRLGLCPAADATRARAHLQAVGLPVSPLDVAGRQHWSVDKLLGHMAKDKKVADGRITFILARGIGDAFITRDVDAQAVRDLLAASIEG
ncbi:MAG: 3-dehydroquinate synthase [Alphaproteobacteria bacterium]|nr:3-dehydroquinate synthase [Alphaproteobacteria bacterium]MBU0796743.1 3-dehydroquinate synthase [Alphaproteobacteria bacterium]MBU0889041.1 3-dehydroquinate synthase [Alphaproteobacteria bacterium]MBU1814061.1 3-dehydroquinate synthase [Alphaproteobacteria bacterium]